MPLPALKYNHNSIKLPIGAQGTRWCPFHCIARRHTYSRTRSPDIRTETIAAIDSVQTQSSKGVKKKRDNDDDDAFTNFRRLLTHENNENGDSDYGEEEGKHEDGENGDDDASWIDRWIDKPSGLGGRKNKEGRPGWGKPEILKTAGITEGQYDQYMVSLLAIFAV